MNPKLIKKMTRTAMESPQKRETMVKALRANPSLRDSLKTRIASETPDLEIRQASENFDLTSDLSDALSQLKAEFKSLLPDAEELNVSTFMGPLKKLASVNKESAEKKFSPETKALVKEFNEKAQKLEAEYKVKSDSIKSDLKAEIKEAVKEQREILKEEGLNKTEREKLLSKTKKKIEGSLPKRVETELSNYKRDMKDLIQEYVKKDPDFRKASGNLNFSQNVWKWLTTTQDIGFLRISGAGFIALLALRGFIKYTARQMGA